MPDFFVYSVEEAAMLMDVSPYTVRRKIAAGEIKAFQDGPGRRWFILGDQFNQYLMQYKASRKTFRKPGPKVN